MKRNRLFLLVVIIAAAIILFFRWYGPSIDQPIKYNHMVHIEQGLECSDCHRSVMNETFASIPGIDVCLECHEEALTESSEEEKIRQFAESESDIPWIQVYEIPDHVFFSHRRHVTVAEIACEECHGEVRSKRTPFTRAQVDFTMDFCLDCHRKNAASEDCLACHR